MMNYACYLRFLLWFSPLSILYQYNIFLFAMQVIKKSIKVQKIARHLVKRCSLFSWLSSLISVTRRGGLNGDENRFFLKHVLDVLKVSA
jgi:nucleolar pre-ribosomal-associated protein 1